MHISLECSIESSSSRAESKICMRLSPTLMSFRRCEIGRAAAQQESLGSPRNQALDIMCHSLCATFYKLFSTCPPRRPRASCEARCQSMRRTPSSMQPESQLMSKALPASALLRGLQKGVPSQAACDVDDIVSSGHNFQRAEHTSWRRQSSSSRDRTR